MRTLNKRELDFVSGGQGVCSITDFPEITPSGGIVSDLSWLYVALVAATSHVIKRVANAL